MHQLETYNYHLPASAIAERPTADRTASRLLVMCAGHKAIQHKSFRALGDYLKSGDLLVFNNTKVIPARLKAIKTKGGGVGEALVERILPSGRMLCQMRFNRPPKIGTALRFEAAASDTDATTGDKDAAVAAEIEESRGELYLVRLLTSEAPLKMLQRIGTVPLPPYIKRPSDIDDVPRYQTVYARHAGAVAAPTAGLHFDLPQLAALKDQGVVQTELTLHVGAGTFQPVRTADIRAHRMHVEYYEITNETLAAVAACRAGGGRVIAVGTTSVRALEATFANHQGRPWAGDTDIFIYPPYCFQAVDAMITNFHSPASTLLMLVSAFAGINEIRSAYQEALEAGYRFLSYGDAMLILPATDGIAVNKGG